MGHRHVRVRQRPDKYAHRAPMQGEIVPSCSRFATRADYPHWAVAIGHGNERRHPFRQEVAIGQAARGGSFAGSASISGGARFGHSLGVLVTALEQPLVIPFEQHGAASAAARQAPSVQLSQRLLRAQPRHAPRLASSVIWSSVAADGRHKSIINAPFQYHLSLTANSPPRPRTLTIRLPPPVGTIAVRCAVRRERRSLFLAVAQHQRRDPQLAAIRTSGRLPRASKPIACVLR